MPQIRATEEASWPEATFKIGTVIREGELLRIVLDDSDVHDLEDAQSLIKAIRGVTSRANPGPFVTDARETTVGPTKAARDYYASDDAQGYSTCNALLVATAYQKLLGNFIAMLSPPQTPLRLFTDEVEAMAWSLETHAQHAQSMPSAIP
jgi:hypothetical protein